MSGVRTKPWLYAGLVAPLICACGGGVGVSPEMDAGDSGADATMGAGEGGGSDGADAAEGGAAEAEAEPDADATVMDVASGQDGRATDASDAVTDASDAQPAEASPDGGPGDASDASAPEAAPDDAPPDAVTQAVCQTGEMECIGNVRCNGNSVETCGVSGSWFPSMTCSDAMPLCVDGGCASN
jgi:hypothetical protein